MYRAVVTSMAVAAALVLVAAIDAKAQVSSRPEDIVDDKGTSGDDRQRSNREQLRNDNRENLLASAYLGTAVDNFAGSAVLTYLNPEDAGPTERRLIFGVDFELRLTGDRDKPVTPKNSQLWIYGETLHGVRSRDVECPTDGESPVVCADIRNKGLFPTLENIPERAAFIVNNATSFEGYMGLRWEFLGINQAEDNQPEDTAAALYLKAQAGLLAITPNTNNEEAKKLLAGSDSVDNHLVAIGVVATNGGMSGSYVEAGFGRTDLFFDRSNGRWKFDALLSFSVAQDWLSPFAQIVVDSDFGDGSDSNSELFWHRFRCRQARRVLRSLESRSVVAYAGGEVVVQVERVDALGPQGGALAGDSDWEPSVFETQRSGVLQVRRGAELVDVAGALVDQGLP